MKQSAVEWLVEQLEQNKFITESQIHLAKEMEKQKIIYAYVDGHNENCLCMNNEKQIFEHAEQYYNETFKKK